MTYGIPYKGSKNFIATYIVDKLASGDTLYDLCCGGGAITHAALLSNKFKSVIAVDCKQNVINLLNGCKSGAILPILDNFKWATREEFQLAKTKYDLTSCYIAATHSFASDWNSYYIHRIHEENENTLVKLLTSNELSERCIAYSKLCRVGYNYNKKGHTTPEPMVRTKRLRLFYECISKYVNKVEFRCDDIFKMTFKDNSVIYIDPPYTGTTNDTYHCKFNFNEFHNLLDKLQKNGYRVFVSEYNLNVPNYHEIGKIAKYVSAQGGAKLCVERLYACNI